MTSEGCVLVAQFGFLLDFVFGKVSDSGFGVAGFPCEGTADVCTVYPFVDGIVEKLLICLGSDVEASDERSTVILRIRHRTFNKDTNTYKTRDCCRLQPRPRWGGESASVLF
jgi:hypothetical protein